MGIQLNWTDTNTAEDGYNVYRSTSSMAGLSTSQLGSYLISQEGQGVTAYRDPNVVEGNTYFYIVAARKGSTIVPGEEIEVEAVLVEDFSTAQIGDEIGGGIYIGVRNIFRVGDFHFVMAKAEGELTELTGDTRWKTTQTETPGASSYRDALENMQAIEVAGIEAHPAALYCKNYTGGGLSDWLLPARDDLNMIFDNLSGHPEIADNVASGDISWTSRENSYDRATWVRLSDKNSSHAHKDLSIGRVRPVRRVAV